MSPKIIKLILSFVIGMALSLIMVLLLEYSNFFILIVIIFSWIYIGKLAYNIILAMSNSKGISILSGIIIGAIGMWILMYILFYWVEAVESAYTGFGVFLSLLPVGLILTYITYSKANMADNNSIN